VEGQTPEGGETKSRKKVREPKEKKEKKVREPQEGKQHKQKLVYQKKGSVTTPGAESEA
jgi:hypothetical protein